MINTESSIEVHLSTQGTLEIPASFWRMIGFEPGETLVAHLEEGRLVLEKSDAIKQRLKGRFAHLAKTRSLADELIDERRESAQKEGDE
jgi:antitoxin component of MazEF toxin-antitoxin module